LETATLGVAGRITTGLGLETATMGVAGRITTGLGLVFELAGGLAACFVSTTARTSPFPVLRVWLVPLSWHPYMVTAIANRTTFDDQGNEESSFINESDSQK